MLLTESPVSVARWTAGALRDLRHLAAELSLRTARDEPLARHTSMGVGGPCPLMVWPRRTEHVRRLTRFMGLRGLGWRILGGGSNLLVSDRGITEVILHTGELVDGNRVDTGCAVFAAGTPTARALRSTVDAGLDGLVWSTGLPGTIGGAAAGNAGCWGSDMAHSVAALEVVAGDGAAHRFEGSDLGWTYRTLRFPQELAPPVTIVAVIVATSEGDPAELRSRYEQLQRTKRERQPVGARNSGCIFRNPEGHPGAGQLIVVSGCKGLRIGDAQVSSRHANFVVNRGAATAGQVLDLIDLVGTRVRDCTGVDLQPEIRQW